MGKNDEQISYATVRRNIKKFKVVFVGDQGVGKSSIISRFTKDVFDNSHNATIGIDFVSKNIEVDGKSIRLQLWDTAGQQRFRSLIPSYLRDSDAAFLIFDLTNEDSFNNLSTWIDFIREGRGHDAIISVIANKLDVAAQRKVSSSTIQAYLSNIGLKHFEVSAKTAQNLTQPFNSICTLLLENSANDFVLHSKPSSKQANNQNKKEQKPQSRQETVIKSINQDKNTKENHSRIITAGKEGRFVRQRNCC